MARARHMPPNLERRGKPTRAPKLRLLIFCEGALTEPAYFEGLARAVGNGLVTVESAAGAGVPLTLVQKALAEKKRRGKARDSYESNDQIWVAFDRDEHPNVAQALDLGRQHKIGVAFSNPCFEIWALIHFGDRDGPIHRHDAQRELAALMTGYDRRRAKSLDLRKMLPLTSDAIGRADRMRKRRVEQGDPLGCPYTSVDQLVSLIVENGKG